MPTLDPQKFDDQAANAVWRPSPQLDRWPVHSVPSTSTPTTSGGPTLQSQRVRGCCSCCETAPASGELAAIVSHSDSGRRLRWIVVTWFCTCLVAMVLLGHSVDAGGGWSEPLSDSYHDGGSQVIATSYAAG